MGEPTSCVVIALGFVACCLASDVPVSGLAAIALLGVYVARNVVVAPYQIFKYLPFHFGIIANVGGCAICGYGGLYLTELQIQSYFAGSLPLLVLSRWLFPVALVSFNRRFGVEGEFLEGQLGVVARQHRHRRVHAPDMRFSPSSGAPRIRLTIRSRLREYT